jgi:HlyD family secretion protein
MSTQQQDVISTLGLDGKRKNHPVRWALLAAVVLTGGYKVLSPASPDDVVVAYVTQAVRQGELVVSVTATGTLQPTRQVDIGSEVSGIIQEVLVDFNDTVTAGQVIARLDTQTLEARLASSTASLAVAKASLAQTEATVAESRAKAKRSEDLAARSLISQQNLETDVAAALRADASSESAKAQVVSAEAALREAQTSLAKAVIRSPIDGMIISRQVDPGQTMAAAFQTPILFSIAEDLGKMELHLDIDESDIGQVREGQSATFRVDAYPGKIFSANIISVRYNPLAVNNIVTYETVLSVDNPELLLRPGMTATADILVEQQPSALLIPNQALRFLPAEDQAAASSSDTPKVWIVENGIAVPVAVETGLTNGEFTEITGGAVTEGTAVIVDIERESRQQQDQRPF